MRNRWHLYDELIDSVDPAERVKSFVYGGHWLMVESDAGGVGLAQHFQPISGAAEPLVSPYEIIGQPLRKVAERIKSWDFNVASIGLAALNAANNTLALMPQSPIQPGINSLPGNAFDFFLSEATGKKVAVIGHFPGLRMLRQHCDMCILERNPKSGDLPDAAAEYVLPEQDIVFVTGTTFINKTITRLLELTKKARVFMVGPSTPMHPLLFDHGFASLSGLVVEDAASIARALKDDDCEAIFAHGGLKVNLLPGGVQ